MTSTIAPKYIGVKSNGFDRFPVAAEIHVKGHLPPHPAKKYDSSPSLSHYFLTQQAMTRYKQQEPNKHHEKKENHFYELVVGKSMSKQEIISKTSTKGVIIVNLKEK